LAAAVGKVLEINRYPVKSFAGERLESCTMETYGMYGDRFGAFYDAAKTGWSSYVTARSIPRMLSYQARLVDGTIQVLTPDGRALGWDQELLNEIQLFAGSKVLSMTEAQAQHFTDPDLMSVDAASVLIITDGSLRKLEALWGKRLDPRRFRANLIVALNEGRSEHEWIGETLSIGNVELSVESYCERCSLITTDPDTYERDPSLLRIVNEQMDLRFGVYASVKKTGQIHVGDQVYIGLR